MPYEMHFIQVKGESGSVGFVPILPLASILNERICTAAICDEFQEESQESVEHLLQLHQACVENDLCSQYQFVQRYGWIKIDLIMAGMAMLKYPDLEESLEYFSLGMVSREAKDRAKKFGDELLNELLNREDFWIRTLLE